IDPQPSRTFTVDVGGKPVPLKQRPPGHRCYAYVLEPPSDKQDEEEAVYKVLISTGPQRDSAGNLENVAAGDLKMEVVFVLESSDFMKKTFKGDDRKPLLGYLQDLVHQIAGEIKSDKELAGAVRLGFAQYWDNVPYNEGDRRLEMTRETGQKRDDIVALLKK